MKYTAVFTNRETKAYHTQYFVSSHDKNQAWQDILSQSCEGHDLILIVPGQQLVYSHIDIDFGNSAG
jgi:hypothetical protein